MYCSGSTQITNSRLQKRVNQVWRRRRCLQCGNTFTTHEAADLSGTLMLLGPNRQLTPLEVDRLFISIYEACKHRPQAVQEARALSMTVLANLRKAGAAPTVERDALVEATKQVLNNFDKTAASVYAAYHPPTAR